MLNVAPHRARLAPEAGMTLIETLIALVTGMIVVAALLAVLEVSLRQSSRAKDVAQATQLGRATMTHITDELHSACVAQGVAPVQASSTENELIFINGYGGVEGKSEVSDVGTAAEGVREDKIVWSSTAHTLTDYTYYATGKGSGGEYLFATAASPAAGVRIGEHVTQIKEGSTTLPIFRYYAYSTSASTSTSATSSQLNETTLASSGKSLGAATAETVASVVVSFSSAPTDSQETQGRTWETLGRAASLVSQATFTFSAPRPEAASTAAPCE